jgi:hypothetical protein
MLLVVIGIMHVKAASAQKPCASLPIAKLKACGMTRRNTDCSLRLCLAYTIGIITSTVLLAPVLISTVL